MPLVIIALLRTYAWIYSKKWICLHWMLHLRRVSLFPKYFLWGSILSENQPRNFCVLSSISGHQVSENDWETSPTGLNAGTFHAQLPVLHLWKFCQVSTGNGRIGDPIKQVYTPSYFLLVFFPWDINKQPPNIKHLFPHLPNSGAH